MIRSKATYSLPFLYLFLRSSLSGPCDPGNPPFNRNKVGLGADFQDRMDQIGIVAPTDEAFVKMVTKRSSPIDEQAEPDCVSTLATLIVLFGSNHEIPGKRGSCLSIT
jgi:hypothetical protein